MAPVLQLVGISFACAPTIPSERHICLVRRCCVLSHAHTCQRSFVLCPQRINPLMQAGILWVLSWEAVEQGLQVLYELLCSQR